MLIFIGMMWMGCKKEETEPQNKTYEDGSTGIKFAGTYVYSGPNQPFGNIIRLVGYSKDEESIPFDVIKDSLKADWWPDSTFYDFIDIADMDASMMEFVDDLRILIVNEDNTRLRYEKDGETHEHYYRYYIYLP